MHREGPIYIWGKKNYTDVDTFQIDHVHFNMSRTAALLLMKIIITFSTVFYDSMLYSY